MKWTGFPLVLEVAGIKVSVLLKSEGDCIPV